MKKHLKCIFIHDHRFKVVEKLFYSEGKITDSVLSRYITPNDSLVIISRVEERDSANGLSLISLKNVYFNPIIGSNFSKAFSLNLLKNLINIRRQLASCNFIVVRAPSFLGLFVLAINIATQKPYFIEVVGDAEEALLTSKKNPGLMFRCAASLIHMANKIFIYNASGSIYVTKDVLQKRYPTKGITSYASNVEVKVKDKILKIENYGVDKDYFKIGLIGSFNNHYKGIAEAIEATSLLHKNNYKIHLHILGSGKLQPEYEKLIKRLNLQDYIHFDGRLEGGEEVINWLEGMNLYIQPSYTEGLPRALIEAMSVGLPAVATNVGGIPELLDLDYLIPPRDSKILANKIAVLISSPELRFLQGQRNYAKSKEYDYRFLQKVRSKFWDTARKLVEEN